MSDPILIVTPVWNDSTRLAEYGKSLAAAFATSPLELEWMIADDGSGAEEAKRLETLRDEFQKTFPHVRVHLASAHRGKGSIIREAWSQSSTARWLAFTDADGSVTAQDLLGLFESAINAQQSVIGIRKRTRTTHISESLWRSFFHHGYLLVVHLILGLRCEDLQCGAKILRGDDYRHIAHRLEEDGFAFDTELLAMLNRQGFNWLEIPVNWAEKKGGKVRPLVDAWSMFKAVLRIRNRL